MVATEEIIKQVGEISGIYLKHSLEAGNIRKNLLADYGAKKEIELIDMIMSSESIDIESKIFLSSYIKSGAKKFFNQVKILNIALDKVNSNDKIVTIDSNWINDFWDKAKNISDEEDQVLWGNILYFNFLNGTCTKTLLNTLYLIDKKGMNYFDAIRKFTFEHSEDVDKVYSCIYFRENTSIYKKYGLHKYSFHQLSNLGLVEYDWYHKFPFPSKNMSLKYGKDIIKISSKKRLEYGNIRLTSDGALLFRALAPIYSKECLDFCLQKWKQNDDAVIEQ